MDCRKPENIQRLYESTGRAALLKTGRLVGRRDVAEEIVQGAFLKLWEAQLGFESERAAYAWIYRACHNAAIDHLRLHATRHEQPACEEMDKVWAADFSAGVEAREWLAKAIAQLSEREAQILSYRVCDGMTQEEIAEVMQLSRKTIVRACAEIDAKLKDRRDAVAQ